ncbi:MAG: ArnT family glycosyltransferase, partial [Anaerolineae bacterium]
MEVGGMGDEVMVSDKRCAMCDVQLWAGLALFILALGARLPGLGAIVTSDEPDWVDYSAKFAQGLLKGNLDETYFLPHPGVTTMWSGTIGLIGAYLFWGEAQSLMDFLEGVSRNPYRRGLFPPMRLPIALFTALCVVEAFFLLRRIFGTKAALLGAVLFALDPFYLAHSRLLHQDALTTSFITLSLLAVAVYLWGGGGKRYLFFSGAAAGLAFLSKVASLILGPFVAGILLINPLPDPPPNRGRENPLPD